MPQPSDTYDAEHMKQKKKAGDDGRSYSRNSESVKD